MGGNDGVYLEKVWTGSKLQFHTLRLKWNLSFTWTWIRSRKVLWVGGRCRTYQNGTYVSVCNEPLRSCSFCHTYEGYTYVKDFSYKVSQKKGDLLLLLQVVNPTFFWDTLYNYCYPLVVLSFWLFPISLQEMKILQPSFCNFSASFSRNRLFIQQKLRLDLYISRYELYLYW